MSLIPTSRSSFALSVFAIAMSQHPSAPRQFGFLLNTRPYLLDNLENDGRDDDNDDNNGKDTWTEIAKTGNTLLVVFVDGSELTTGRSYEVKDTLAGMVHAVTSDAVIHAPYPVVLPAFFTFIGAKKGVV
ncbi:hypothetical protein IWX49DRAFT_71731 [Phyllosticta citricarpa]|uniref:Uncharacterized protein n=1 Tax=Phyllosticta citricarpa TaxID=55181 RepID=A0ABR1LSC1_9PEZI